MNFFKPKFKSELIHTSKYDGRKLFMVYRKRWFDLFWMAMYSYDTRRLKLDS